MTNVRQTVQVCFQSGRRDWFSLKSIMFSPYWQWASIKIYYYFFFWMAWREEKTFSRVLLFNWIQQSMYESKNVGWISAGAIDFPLIRFITRLVLLGDEFQVMLFQPVKEMMSYVYQTAFNCIVVSEIWYGEVNMMQWRKYVILRFSQCHLMPNFCSLHCSKAFILKYIDVSCQHFVCLVWCSWMLFFCLKAGTSQWVKTFFYTSVLRRLKAKMAHHK